MPEEASHTVLVWFVKGLEPYMPKYVVCINRTLVLTTSVETETPDKDVAEEVILKLEEEGKFGVIAWKVENATCDTINGWQRGADYITIERVMDVQS